MVARPARPSVTLSRDSNRPCCTPCCHNDHQLPAVLPQTLLLSRLLLLLPFDSVGCHLSRTRHHPQPAVQAESRFHARCAPSRTACSVVACAKQGVASAIAARAMPFTREMNKSPSAPPSKALLAFTHPDSLHDVLGNIVFAHHACATTRESSAEARERSAPTLAWIHQRRMYTRRRGRRAEWPRVRSPRRACGLWVGPWPAWVGPRLSFLESYSGLAQNCEGETCTGNF